jgi:hypothetical protein
LRYLIHSLLLVYDCQFESASPDGIITAGLQRCLSEQPCQLRHGDQQAQHDKVGDGERHGRYVAVAKGGFPRHNAVHDEKVNAERG